MGIYQLLIQAYLTASLRRGDVQEVPDFLPETFLELFRLASGRREGKAGEVVHGLLVAQVLDQQERGTGYLIMVGQGFTFRGGHIHSAVHQKAVGKVFGKGALHQFLGLCFNGPAGGAALGSVKYQHFHAVLAEVFISHGGGFLVIAVAAGNDGDKAHDNAKDAFHNQSIILNR